tara:strand:- start:7810 stop:8208 length:399 start_codon:yes stop_codon:yes gene_type:complete
MKYTIPSGFIIGVASIDEEHQAILTEINRIKKTTLSATPDSLKLSLSGICEMLKSHFANEEAFMAEIGFPEMEAHAREHGELLERVKAVQKTDPADIVGQIHSFLDAAFQDMGRSDIYLREFMESGEACFLR